MSLSHGLLRSVESGLDFHSERVSSNVQAYDVKITPSHDLCFDVFFSLILRDISAGKHDGGCVMAPPCATFGGGHQYVGRRQGSEIYGVKGLTSREAEQVKIKTLCALRCGAAAMAHDARSVVLSRVMPWVWKSSLKGDMFELPEVLAMAGNVQNLKLHQCTLMNSLNLSLLTAQSRTHVPKLDENLAGLFSVCAKDVALNLPVNTFV